jgi:hypothetical protein
MFGKSIVLSVASTIFSSKSSSRVSSCTFAARTGLLAARAELSIATCSIGLSNEVASLGSCLGSLLFPAARLLKPVGSKVFALGGKKVEAGKISGDDSEDVMILGWTKAKD